MQVGRLSYFIFSLILNVLAIVLDKSEADVLLIILLVLAIYVMSCRFKDVGLTRWWFLGLCVPLLNVYPSYFLIFAPSGYMIKDHPNFEKSDGIMTLGVVLTLLGIFSMLLIIVSGGH